MKKEEENVNNEESSGKNRKKVMDNKNNHENKENKNTDQRDLSNNQSNTQRKNKNYVFKEAEKRWRDFWFSNEVFAFNGKDRKKEIFSIDTPPPTVSGDIHIGHALGYSQLDFVARYHRMRGKNVFYPFGFDDNGLATERFVEKLTQKKATDMSRIAFTKLCLDTTKEIEAKLKRQLIDLGISADWNLFYSTINEKSRKISQLSFIELYKKNREYRKQAPVLWCPNCHTAIAQVEAEDEERESYFNDIVFKVLDQDNSQKDLIISTTRPEFLPACVAVFVHPDDERYKSIVGKEAVVPLFNFKVPILKDERVDIEKGSGAVMCCTFGDVVDVEWYLAYNLPLKEAISKDGKMTKIAGKYEGFNIYDARDAIVEDLKKQGLLKSQKKIKHFVKVHERCSTELEIIHSYQWFIRYLDLKDEFIKLGRELEWYPEHMINRYENWVNGLQWDWCISRQRFFGVPFPVWYCKECNEIILADEKDLPVDPLVDKPPVESCPTCGSKEFIPETDVMDTWATSSLTPFIITDWRIDSGRFNRLFPMTLRPNGHDIISFWLFNTVVKSYLHESKLPWKKVMINGFVLDPRGKKMSKSKGNAFHPEEIIESYGADCLRYWASTKTLGEDIIIEEKEFLNGRKLIKKLWNASMLVINYLRSKNYKKIENKNLELETIDKWILYTLDKVIEQSISDFDNFKFSKVRNSVENFFWNDFCDNYLEIVKDRIYNQDKYEEWQINSLDYTLYNTLLSVIKIFAPFIPYVTEEIYQDYFKDYEKDLSIHISQWPNVFNKSSNLDYDSGELLVDILSSIRKYKNQNRKSLKAKIDLSIYFNESEYNDLFEIIKETLKPVANIRNLEISNEEYKNKTEIFKIGLLIHFVDEN